MSVQIPASHAPIDWNNWQPPVEGDVRSPCPMLNVLANHNILPHSGKGITKEAVMNALTTSINLGPKIADTFASKAVTMNPDGKGTSFDLDHLAKHGPIEHDSSLSRSDFHLGDNHTYNHEVWSDTMESYGDNEMTNFKLASRARYARLMKCKKEHEAVGRSFRYGVIEFILSYGETALFLGILGDPVNGKIPVSYVKALFEEERMPVKEGWTRLPKPLVQNDMNWLMYHLFMANDHKFDELRQIGVGSITGAMSFMSDNTSGKCTVM